MVLPHRALSTLSRRAFLGGACAATLGSLASTAHAHSNAGVVDPPLAPPGVALTMDDGRTATLQGLLAGRVSALQLMFASCRATCPIQGALFAEGAKKLGDRIKDAQWLSLSIDPARDDARSLRAWLERFGAHPRWHAGRPDPKQLDALVDFLKARVQGPDGHTAQVYYFDRRGLLVLRSVDFTPAAEIVRVMGEIEKRG